MQHLARQHSGKRISNFDNSRRVSGRTVNRVGLLTALCSGGLCGDQLEEAIADNRLRTLLSSLHLLKHLKLSLTHQSEELKDLFQLEDPREIMMMRVITQSMGSLNRCLLLLNNITVLISTEKDFICNTTSNSMQRSSPLDDSSLTLYFNSDMASLGSLLESKDVHFIGIGSKSDCGISCAPGEIITTLTEYGFRYVNFGIAPYTTQINDSVVSVGNPPFTGQCCSVGESQNDFQYIVTQTGRAIPITSADVSGCLSSLDINDIHHILI